MYIFYSPLTLHISWVLQDEYIGQKEEWTLMCFPFEVNAICPEYASSPLSFEVSCGTFGNSVDGKIQTQGAPLLYSWL